MSENRTDLTGLLQEIPIFSGLEEAEIDCLAEIAVRRTCGESEAVIHENEISNALYVLLRGEAQAVTVGASGRKHVHNRFQPGDYFGEMSFIDGEPRSATVEMTAPGEVLEIGGDQFLRMTGRPDVLLRFIKGLLKKIRTATRQIEDMEFAIGNHELHEAHTETIRRLVLAAECKDANTANHIVRVSRYSVLTARKLGLSAETVKNICYAAPMHDIGKIGIPKYILWKPGRLDAEEFEIIKKHPRIGARILDNPRTEILKLGRTIALHHHERFEGSGYPIGLCGDTIPLEARIVALVDAFDAIVSCRPYKLAVPVDAALEIIRKDRGSHFDPVVADAFLDSREAVKTILKESIRAPITRLDEFSWCELLV